MSKKVRVLIFGAASVALIAVGAFVVLSLTSLNFSSSAYAELFTLSQEEISKSASIEIHIPEHVTIAPDMSPNIVFSPKIKGDWIESTEDRTVIYKPKKDLKPGRYYAIELHFEETVLRHEFLAVENPEIAAVFPAEGVEAHEDSEISIIFNRAMVPLTTIDELEATDIPVELIPETPGTFSWISTRNLQFIPEDTLMPSTAYTLKLHAGLESADGVAVAPTEHTFQTRRLRYTYMTSSGERNKNKLSITRPLIIKFNQEVDLERTAPYIILSLDDSDNTPIPVDITYGERTERDGETRKTVVDKKVLEIRQSHDTFGREGLFDFEASYNITLQNAFPLSGTLELEEGGETSVSFDDLVKHVSAASPRSSYVKPTHFDPEGTLILSFYDSINLKRSQISHPNIADISYVRTCAEEETEPFPDCAQVDDRTRIAISFDAALTREAQQVSLDTIVTDEGVSLLAESKFVQFDPVDPLKVLKVLPSDGSKSVDPKTLKICTNNPLITHSEETVDDAISAAPDYVFFGWNDSYRSSGKGQYQPCEKDTYLTVVSYGLDPYTEYDLSLDLEDLYESESEARVSFKSRGIDSSDIDFRHLQKTYTNTTPKNTVLTYRVRNLPYIDVHMCKIGPKRMAELLNKKLNYKTAPLTDCDETVTKRVEAPKGYWRQHFLQVDLKDYFGDVLGHYMLSMSHPDYTQYNSPNLIYERTYLSVTNLAVVEKKIDRSSSPYGGIDTFITSPQDMYWTVYTDTLEPVLGARIDRYKKNQDKSLTLVDTGYTNTDGVSSMAHARVEATTINTDTDSAIVLNTQTFDYSYDARALEKMFIYTDRPIYKPGDEVHVKAWQRVGYDGNFTILAGEDMTLFVKDSLEKQIYSEDHAASEYGTITTSFTIPSDAPLGQYRICVDGSCESISVQEYVPAAFKVDLSADAETYISKDTASFTLDAAYYFGVQLEEGSTINYSLVSQDYYFDAYEDEWFAFGRPWYSCYYSCDYGDRFDSRGEAVTDADGKAVITHDLDFETMFENEEDRTSKLFTLYATVQNSDGQTIGAEHTIVVHAGEFYTGVKTDKYYVAPEDTFIVRGKTVDIDGVPMSKKRLKLEINKVSWVKHDRQEVDGGFYGRYERVLTPVVEDTVSTNADGDVTSEYTLTEAGQHIIILKGTDSRGNSITSRSNIYVSGYSPRAVRPSQDTSLEIETQRDSLSVGDTASFIVQSPYERAKALVSIERGDIYSYEILDIDGSSFSYEFPIVEGFVPSVNASVVLISDEPDIKYGTQTFTIDRDIHDLDITIAPNKSDYLPGESVTLDVSVRQSDGTPVQTELSIAVADLSVLALKGNPKENPVTFFYSGFPFTVHTGSNLRNILQEVEITEGTKGGGGDASVLAAKKRGEFRDTAHFEGTVVTDAQGNGQVTFTLPDNLTTWQVESLGITKDTAVGAGYETFVSRKALMAVPLKPRFIIPEDTFTIGAKIFNQTDSKQTITVSLDAPSLTMRADTKKNVTLKAEEQTTVYFDVAAPKKPEAGRHTFTITARSDEHVDIVENHIAIVSNSTFESTATAGVTRNNIATEYVFIPDVVKDTEGELTLRTSATLATHLSDGLTHVFTGGYSSTGYVSSQLATIAVLTSARSIPNINTDFGLDALEYDDEIMTAEEIVPILLSNLYTRQTSSGGFVYYSAGQYWGDPNMQLTIQAIDAMKKLQIAGYPVSKSVLRNAERYVRSTLRARDINDVIYAAYVLQQGESNRAEFNINIKSYIDDNEILTEKLSSMTLARLAVVVETGDYANKYKRKVMGQLESRLVIDARGAFLPPTSNYAWRHFESAIANTATYIEALAVHDELDAVLTDESIRWLLSNKDIKRDWGSHTNTQIVVQALTKFLMVSKETEAEYTVEMLVADKPQAMMQVHAETIFDPLTASVAIEDIPKNENTKISFARTRQDALATNMYYDMALRYFLPADRIPPRDKGFTVEQAFYRLDDVDNEHPVTDATVGEVLRSQITVYVPVNRNYVIVQDTIPAGMEIVNTDLDTEPAISELEPDQDFYRQWWNRSILLPDFKEFRNEGVHLEKVSMRPGKFTYTYLVRALIPGEYTDIPARAHETFFPENFGRTAGRLFTISQ